jgi:hypothetical protein
MPDDGQEEQEEDVSEALQNLHKRTIKGGLHV